MLGIFTAARALQVSDAWSPRSSSVGAAVDSAHLRREQLDLFGVVEGRPDRYDAGTGVEERPGIARVDAPGGHETSSGERRQLSLHPGGSELRRGQSLQPAQPGTIRPRDLCGGRDPRQVRQSQLVAGPQHLLVQARGHGEGRPRVPGGVHLADGDHRAGPDLAAPVATRLDRCTQGGQGVLRLDRHLDDVEADVPRAPAEGHRLGRRHSAEDRHHRLAGEHAVEERRRWVRPVVEDAAALSGHLHSCPQTLRRARSSSSPGNSSTPRFHAAASTASAAARVSADGRAAWSPVERSAEPATRCPSRSRATWSSPRRIPDSQPAAKASPAPTGSTTSTRSAGTRSTPPSWKALASTPPSLTTTTAGSGSRARTSAAVAAPQRTSASSRPTKTTSAARARPSSSGPAAPGGHSAGRWFTSKLTVASPSGRSRTTWWTSSRQDSERAAVIPLVCTTAAVAGPCRRRNSGPMAAAAEPRR